MATPVSLSDPTGLMWAALERGGSVRPSGGSFVSKLVSKLKSTGAFADLGERMSLRNVRNVAGDAGIGLKGVKVKINRQEDLIGTGLAGYAPDANTIVLYPDAFESTTTLRQTLGHERTHIYQKRTFGDTDDPMAAQQYERDTYALDYQW